MRDPASRDSLKAAENDKKKQKRGKKKERENMTVFNEIQAEEKIASITRVPKQ
jgi:hypothetical protein